MGNGWTIMILVEASEKYQVFDLGAILRQIPGRLGQRAECFTNLVIWMSLLTCLVGYLIIIADSMHSLVIDTVWDSRPLWVTVGSIVCLPLCFVDQKHLSFTSALSIAVNVYLIGYVAYRAIVAPAHASVVGGVANPVPICYFALTKGSVSMFSNLMIALIIQMCVLPMYESLEDRSVPRFRKIVVRSFSAAFVLFSGFFVAGILAFGVGVKYDILSSLPKDVFGNAARVGMLVVVLGVYPLMLMPMVQPLKNTRSTMVVKSITVGIVLAVMGVGYFVSNLALMNVLNGAVCVAAFIGIAPGLTGIFLTDRSRTAMYALIVASVALCILGLVWTDNFVGDLASSCFM